MLAVILQQNPPPGETSYKHSVSVENLPIPKIEAGQVLVKLQAAAYNHRDEFIRNGLYPGIQFGSTLGSDGVGIVVDGDDELTDQRVIICPGVGWEKDPRGPEGKYRILGLLPLPGTFAEYIVVPRKDVFPAPAHLSIAEAAALPLAGLTAWRATFTKANVQSGDYVLITGIGGGVALTALQFAVSVGANVYVTSSDDNKIKRAVELGAKGGVNYKNDAWPNHLRSLLGSNLLHSIIDGAGGPLHPKYPALMRLGGIISVYGMTVAPQVTFTMSAVLKNVDLKGSTMGSRAEFEQMVRFVNEHRIRPIVSGVWKGLTKENVEAAYEVMRNGKQFGKLVLEFDAAQKL
ncbi:hypothetical protein BC936DRAFT_141207 [Jimgerdemannia flammicorona]|uniref:Enoyl reductase (ER) domain-containing protein n=1 Tax=Jimgerdemannia flammicorona TaxID=994334 RepID=A0A433DGA3_9FUNG|nr:hypothetical protein BC936DRAFT_141207 [Jimgerdemannia flammicorona]